MYNRYIFRILFIIFLTFIPALVIVASHPEVGIGWILGSVGSIGNFIWLSISTKGMLDFIAEESRLSAFKGFHLRYLALIVYSVVVVLVVKPDILTFGAGLVSVQMSIYLNLLIDKMKND